MIRNVEVRWVAAIALGNLGSPDAIDPLNRALKGPDRYVKYGAAQALRSPVLGLPQTIPIGHILSLLLRTGQKRPGLEQRQPDLSSNPQVTMMLHHG